MTAQRGDIVTLIIIASGEYFAKTISMEKL
jgi:hypothetical protein